jgi:hypothetical protein
MREKIHSGLYCICFELPKNKTEIVKFKLGHSINVEIEVQKYLGIFKTVVLIAQINLKKSRWEGSGKPADMRMTHYTDKIYEIFCMLYKINKGGYFRNNVENVYSMFRDFSDKMFVDTKLLLHSIKKENNYNLKARAVITPTYKIKVIKTMKPIMVSFD